MNITRETPNIQITTTLNLEGRWLYIASRARLGAFDGYEVKSLHNPEDKTYYRKVIDSNEELTIQEYAVTIEDVLDLVRITEEGALDILRREIDKRLTNAEEVRRLVEDNNE